MKNPWWKLPLWGRLTIAAVVVVGMIAFVWQHWERAARQQDVWLEGVKPWPRVPIVVEIGPGLEIYRDAIYGGMDVWSDEVKCKLFVVDSEKAADVRILSSDYQPCGGFDRSDSVPHPTRPGSTYFCPGGPVEVHFYRLDDVREAFQLAAHELGHVLGLRHTDRGLMAEGFEPMYLVLPDEAHRRRLQERYCGARP